MIEEILQKIINGEHVTDADKDILKNYKPLSEDDIASKVIAKERKRTDKMKNEYETKLEEISRQFEEMKEQEGQKDVPELDKLSKQLEKIQKQLAEKEDLIKQKDQDIFNHKKGSILNSIKSKIDLAKGYDTDYVDFTLNKLSAEYEDLDDLAEYSDDIVKAFTESHPQLIRAEGSGTGIKASKQAVDNKVNIKNLDKLSDSDIEENLGDLLTQIVKK